MDPAKYNISTRIDGKYAMLSLSGKAAEYYLGTDPLTVFEYGSEEKRYAYSYAENPYTDREMVSDLTFEELQEAFEKMQAEKEKNENGGFDMDKKTDTEKMQPDGFLTGEHIRTPRGSFSPNRKYWSVTPRGDGRASVRLYRLGDNYTNTAILERLAENQKRTVEVDAAKERNRTYSLFILRLKKYTGKKDRITGLYWHYRYLLGNVQKNPGRSLYLPHRLKEDVARLKEISEEARFLSEEKIETLSDLKGLMEKYISELADLEDLRRELRNELRRKGSEGRAPGIRAEIAEVSALMEKDRKALKRCRNIEARSAQIFETVMQTEAQQEKIKESERSENVWTLEQTPPGRS